MNGTQQPPPPEHDLVRLATDLSEMASSSGMLGPLQFNLDTLQDDHGQPFLTSKSNQQGTSHRQVEHRHNSSKGLAPGIKGGAPPLPTRPNATRPGWVRRRDSRDESLPSAPSSFNLQIPMDEPLCPSDHEQQHQRGSFRVLTDTKIHHDNEIKRLWPGGVSSVYLREAEAAQPTHGVALVKKAVRLGGHVTAFDSSRLLMRATVHEFSISHLPHAPSAWYTLDSTIEVHKDKVGGSTSNSSRSELPVEGPSTSSQHSSHARNVTQLIEQQEKQLRETLQDIHRSIAAPQASTTADDDYQRHAYPPAPNDAGDDYGDSGSRQLLDEFGIDETMPPTSGRVAAQNGPFTLWLRRFLQLPLRILAIPIGLLGIAFGIVARLLRIRPGQTSLGPRNPFARDARSLQRMDPVGSAERFVRSIEEMTGAVRWSRRLGDAQGSSSSVVGTSSGGSSSLERRRSGSNSSARKALPDFWIGSYESVLKKAKDDFQVLMVVLTCDEHEDDELFKRRVLTDPELLNALAREKILVWGGDVRDVDAYQASKALQFFRLPFVAFVALQPQSSNPTLPGSASISSPKLSVVTRLEGSPSSTLSASSLLAHLTNVVLPRVNPFMARLKAQHATRLEERRLRQKQDRAFAMSAQKDEERVLRKRAEESQRQRDVEERKRKEEAALRIREGSKKWRAWKRGQLQVEGEREGVRIGVRLGDGRRVVRSFAKEAKVEDVYAYVECSFETDDGERREAPPEDYEHIYEFQLAAPFPRYVLEVDGDAGQRTLEQIPWLEKNASLIVEGLEQRRISLGKSEASDDEEIEEDDN
ncbi:BZ3500_MvSof-1268-A1-R1_Chr5-3g08244 [Microbotryum saponariae]|uniref:BZ3500_MvSof-1268-A1-R1_Chr5-3g08244 protein n=1 Tax=Microbotryum saponariae TaxID=289078 RepID=A0A2X0MJQ6_9BASI|nr:BZ3500_MvSof-1268-A1-R1_Chr5-3g08244 [Microbotryum saponariae]SDA08352.1 BZ3501_MvSof-1269-A2-R1_Chr5-3g07972 [Microbotryum saponariae]